MGRAGRGRVSGSVHGSLPDRDLLSRLVAYDTTSRFSNLPLADFVADYLDGPGTRLTRLPSPDGHKASLLIETGPPSRDGAGLVLSGHMDVVPADEAGWRSDPFRLEEQGDRYAARGSADMKGFLALAVNRFAALRRPQLRAPLALLLTYDEEIGTVGARRFVETFDAERPLPRSVVIGEPTDLRVIRSHKGMLRLRLSFEGRAAHSGYPHLGRSAIEPAARAIVALAALRHQMELERPAYAELFPAVPYPALNTGIVQGGSAANVIPDHCDIQLGIRLLPGMSAQAMADRVETAVREAIGQETFSMESLSESPAMMLPLDSMLAPLLHDCGGTSHDTGVMFASDAGWLQRRGMECVLFGPGSIEAAHRPNEFLPIAEFRQAGAVLDRLIARACVVP